MLPLNLLGIHSPESRLPGRWQWWGLLICHDDPQARFGTGTGGIVAMGIPMIAMFFCGGSSVTSNSRMLWSFSRDGALPGYKLWSSVNPWTKTPVNAVMFMVTLAFILGLPMLSSVTAFSAVISISTIGLYISCETPLASPCLHLRWLGATRHHAGCAKLHRLTMKQPLQIECVFREFSRALLLSGTPLSIGAFEHDTPRR